MRFLFKNKEYSFPSSLSQVTLQQRIDFNAMYGKDLAATEKELSENPDPDQNLVHQMDVACKAFSFFSGIPLDDVRLISVSQVWAVYSSCLAQLFQQQEDLQLRRRYLFNDEVWNLAAPELTYQSDITFNEIITAKQVTKQMSDLGAGRWEALPYLCAVFLRKDGEEFDERWMSPESDRVALMHALPMDIAVEVAFFLKCSMIFYSTTSQSSEVEEMEKART